MKYSWILFDADETLFSFDSFTGLKMMFSQFGVDYTDADHQVFESVNRPLWVEYQNGAINAAQLQTQRFQAWADRLDVSPLVLNARYQDAMAEVCQPLDGVMTVIPQLAKQSRLGIITNGFAQMQQTRLENTKLSSYFEFVVVSETVGVAKPDVAIFQAALEKMGSVTTDQVLMVGDNPLSDILGGQNVGFDTCWLNPHHAACPAGVNPTFQVENWAQLHAHLLKRDCSE